MWRYRGTPHFLRAQADRLGLAAIDEKTAASNREIFKVSQVLAQLCERYHRARHSSQRPVFAGSDLAQIRDALEQGERTVCKLHALAGSAAAMLDEAWEAFGFPAPDRHYAVTAESDDLPYTLPLGDGTVGLADIEPALTATTKAY